MGWVNDERYSADGKLKLLNWIAAFWNQDFVPQFFYRIVGSLQTNLPTGLNFLLLSGSEKLNRSISDSLIAHKSLVWGHERS